MPLYQVIYEKLRMLGRSRKNKKQKKKKQSQATVFQNVLGGSHATNKKTSTVIYYVDYQES